jgi:hypothetical protein
VDLSPAAWDALGLNLDTDVLLVFSPHAPQTGTTLPQALPNITVEQHITLEPHITVEPNIVVQPCAFCETSAAAGTRAPARTPGDRTHRFVVQIRPESAPGMLWNIIISARDEQNLPVVRIPFSAAPAPSFPWEIMITAGDDESMPVVYVWARPGLIAPSWEVMTSDQDGKIELVAPVATGGAGDGLPAGLTAAWELMIPGDEQNHWVVIFVRSELMQEYFWNIEIIGIDEESLLVVSL